MKSKRKQKVDSKDEKQETEISRDYANTVPGRTKRREGNATPPSCVQEDGGCTGHLDPLLLHSTHARSSAPLKSVGGLDRAFPCPDFWLNLVSLS